jgi:hypothetical protein
LRSKGAQRTEHTWTQARQLGFPNRPTGGNFIRLRIPVLGWTTLNDIENVDLLACQPYRRNNAVQELSCRPNEWLALQILVAPWGFTHENQIGLGIARAEHDLGASGMQATLLTIAY